MATQRYISTSFWDDAWIQILNPNEKLLYLYLMTNPITNIAGVYKITLRRIEFDTGLKMDILQTILERFKRDKKAYLFDEYLILPSWPKHQKWESRAKIKSGIETILKELSPEILGYMVSIGYTYPIDTISIPYHNYEEKQNQSEKDLEQKTDKVSIPYAYHQNYSDLDSDLDSDYNLKKINKKEISSPLSKKQNSKNAFSEISEYWNEKVPQQKTPFTELNMSLSHDLIELLDSTNLDTIKTSIDHYSEAYDFNDFPVKGFTNFMTKKNVENWYPESSVSNLKEKYGGDGGKESGIEIEVLSEEEKKEIERMSWK